MQRPRTIEQHEGKGGRNIEDHDPADDDAHADPDPGGPLVEAELAVQRLRHRLARVRRVRLVPAACGQAMTANLKRHSRSSITGLPTLCLIDFWTLYPEIQTCTTAFPVRTITTGECPRPKPYTPHHKPKERRKKAQVAKPSH